MMPEEGYDQEYGKENAPSQRIQEQFKQWVTQTQKEDAYNSNSQLVVKPEKLLIATIGDSASQEKRMQKVYHSFIPPSQAGDNPLFTESNSLAVFRQPDKTEIELTQHDESGNYIFILYEDNVDPNETHLSVFNNFGEYARQDFNYLFYNSEGRLEAINVETFASDQSLFSVNDEQLKELAESGGITTEIGNKIVQLIDSGMSITLIHDNKSERQFVRTTTTAPKTINIEEFFQEMGVDEQCKLSSSDFISADDRRWRKTNIPRTLGIVTKVEFPE